MGGEGGGSPGPDGGLRRDWYVLSNASIWGHCVSSGVTGLVRGACLVGVVVTRVTMEDFQGLTEVMSGASGFQMRTTGWAWAVAGRSMKGQSQSCRDSKDTVSVKGVRIRSKGLRVHHICPLPCLYLWTASTCER